MNNQIERQPQTTANGSETAKQRLLDNFIEKLGSVFNRRLSQEKPQAESYIKTSSNPRLRDDTTAQRRHWRNLNEALNRPITPAGRRGNESQDILSVAKEAILEASQQETPARTILRDLASISVPDSAVLPYARYVYQTLAEPISDSFDDRKILAHNAFEIFINETNQDRTSLRVFKNVVGVLSRNLSDDDQQRLGTYIQELGHEHNFSLEETLQATTSERLMTKELSKLKDDILRSITSEEQRVKLDLHVLALTPDRILELLRETIPAYAENGSPFGRSVHHDRDDIDNVDNRQKIGERVDRWLIEANLTVDDSTHEQIYKYIFNLRNIIDDQRENIAPKYRALFAASRPAYMERVNALEDKDRFLAALFMLHPQDAFLFNEYFKGKTAELVKTKAIDNPEELTRFMNFVSKEQEYAVKKEDIYNSIFKDIKALLFYSMTASGSEVAGFFRHITEGISAAKETKLVKTPLALGSVEGRGGVHLTYEYEQGSETSILREQQRVLVSLYDPTMAHVAGVYLGRAQQFSELYRGFSDFVKEAESGDADKLLAAAKNIKTESLDLLFVESPIIMDAYFSYLRLVRSRIAMNGGQIPADLLARYDYGKIKIDKELEDDLKSTHEMSDPEREVYLKIGKALTIVNGDLIATLSAGLPQMDVVLSEMSPELKNKYLKMNGEALTKAEVEELKQLEMNLVTSLRDYPFKALLFSMNPLKNLFMWLNFDEYNNFLLGYVPMRPDKPCLDAVEMWQAAQAMRKATFFGVDDDAAKWLREGWIIPALELDKYSKLISLGKRGGLRDDVIELTRQDYTYSEQDKEAIDGYATLKKLLNRSPKLAQIFLERPPKSARIVWEGSEKGVKDNDFKQKLYQRVFEHMRQYFPTFFIQSEERRFFRRDEMSFNEAIQEYLRRDLYDLSPQAQFTEGKPARQASNYWLLLNSEEKEAVGMADKARPSLFGAERTGEEIQARLVFERFTNILMEGETISRHLARDKIYLSTEAFVQQSIDHLNQSANLNSADEFASVVAVDKNYSRFYQAIRSRIDKLISVYKLSNETDTKDQLTFRIFKEYVRFADSVFYKDKESIYHTRKFIGIAELPDNIVKQIKKGKRLSDFSGADQATIAAAGVDIISHYSSLVKDGLLVHPFDWTYLNDANIAYQATGLMMIPRVLDDFNAVLNFGKLFMPITNLQKNGTMIKDQEEIVKMLTSGLEGHTKDVMKSLNTSYGLTEADEGGWLAYSYAMMPFVGGRLNDIALASTLFGAVGLSNNGWATMMNNEDYWRQTTLNMANRKKIFDHWKKKPWETRLFNPRENNKKTVGLTDEVLGIKLPFGIGHALNKVWPQLGRKTEEIYDSKNPKRNFLGTAVRTFSKIEKPWLNSNIFLRLLLIGTLLMMLKAITDGFKELDSK